MRSSVSRCSFLSFKLLRPLCGALFFASSVVYAQPPIIDPDITTDMLTGATPEQRQQKAWDEFKAQNAAREKTDAKAALQAYSDFYTRNDKMAAPVAVSIALHMGELYSQNLKDTDTAARIYNSAFERYHDFPPAVDLLTRSAQMLLDAKKPAEAEALLLAHRDDIARTWRHIAVPALDAWSQALQAQNKSDERIGLLQEALLDHPDLLGGAIQNYDGVFYDSLIEALLKADRKDEALSWAKLRFMAAPYEAGAIDRASRMLANVWTRVEPDKKGLQAFSLAQKDAAKTNPLQAVALPELDATQLQARVARMAGGGDGVSERVVLLIAGNRLGEAMREAQTLLKNKNTAEKGALEAARVFKAADLSLLSANAFLKYLQKPTGADPIAAFLQAQKNAPGAGQ